VRSRQARHVTTPRIAELRAGQRKGPELTAAGFLGAIEVDRVADGLELVGREQLYCPARIQPAEGVVPAVVPSERQGSVSLAPAPAVKIKVSPRAVSSRGTELAALGRMSATRRGCPWRWSWMRAGGLCW
jgi:hypothetical protein